MNDHERSLIDKTELSDEEMDHIRGIFHEEMVPKLQKTHARLGLLNCDFAGKQFRHWSIQFRSIGNDFEIVEFEYDEEGCGIDLDL